VPSASYTVICDDSGDEAVAVPVVGVAGKFAASVTLDVATGL
jgi:hypothetical protein